MRGGAQSHLMRCSDNYYYVVKFQNNPRHRRILTGALRLRLVEEQDEYARIRRLQPAADEDVLRGFRDELEDQFSTYLRNRRAEMAGTPAVGEELQKLIENWNNTLSNGLQLAP